jgi:ribosomal protein L16 Arg81 hydroxylase
MQAYEEKKSYFSWENDRWGYEKIREYWLEDIKTENTNLFIVDTKFIPLPDFVQEYLKNNTELTKCISSYCIYKK